MHIAGLVLGILASSGILGFTAPFALPCGIVGIILSVLGKKKLVADGKPTGAATAGLVLSIIGTVLAGIGIICFCVCAAGAAGLGGLGAWY